LRRSVALRALRPDLALLPLRGNVDTRLRKVDAGEYDAVVVARAGLVRLGLEGRATEVLSPELSLPAPGQGALGIECREGDASTRALVAPLHHPDTALCVTAERAALEAVGGDCKTPFGAYAERRSDSMYLRVFMAEPAGGNVRSAERSTRWPANEGEAHAIGFKLGRDALQKRA
jgi:hydroxymethylbilane synthase